MTSTITNEFRTRWFLFTLLVALALLQLVIVIVNHYYYRSYALDYAIYNFAFYDFAHLRVSPVPAYIYPVPSNFLQDHFSLTLPVLSPLFWLLNPLFGSYSLLIIQWLFILIGARATFRFISTKTQIPYLPYAAAIYYFVLFGRYAAYLNDVNLAIIGASLLPLFLYYFNEGKTVKAALLFCVLLLNREDYALWLFFVAMFLVIAYRKNSALRRLALYFGCAAVLYFLLVMAVIIPALETADRKYNLFDFSAVGSTPLEALKFIVTHPIKAIELLFVNHSGEAWHDGRKLEFYEVYLLSGAVLLFLRPAYLLPFVPILLKKMYDDNPLRWSIEGYYSVEFVSLMPLLIFWIVAEFKQQRLQQIIVVTMLLAASSITVWKIKTMPINPIVGQSNKYNFFEAGFYNGDVDPKRLNSVLQSIPPNESVCATGRLLPHLAARERVYYFPRFAKANYVVVLRNNDFWPLYANEFEAAIDSLRNDTAWLLKSEDQSLLLFARKQLLRP